MICCKIVTDYHNINGKFDQLLRKLANCGDFLWEDNNLYFANYEDSKIDSKYISRILRQCGYKNFFISVFSKENNPSENERINGWIIDKLIKINYTTYEKTSQNLFTNISKGLDMLDKEIEVLREQKNKLIQEAESDEH